MLVTSNQDHELCLRILLWILKLCISCGTRTFPVRVKQRTDPLARVLWEGEGDGRRRRRRRLVLISSSSSFRRNKKRSLVHDQRFCLRLWISPLVTFSLYWHTRDGVIKNVGVTPERTRKVQDANHGCGFLSSLIYSWARHDPSASCSEHALKKRISICSWWWCTCGLASWCHGHHTSCILKD